MDHVFDELPSGNVKLRIGDSPVTLRGAKVNSIAARLGEPYVQPPPGSRPDTADWKRWVHSGLFVIPTSLEFEVEA